MFLEKLLNYYRGDHLLLQGQDQNHPHVECTDEDNYTNREIFNKYKEDNCKLRKDIIGSQLKNTNTKYCEINDNDDFESEDYDHLCDDDDANHYIIEKETQNEDEANTNCEDLNVEGYHNKQENEINVEFIENSKFGFLMMNENECMVSEFNEKNQQNKNKIAFESAEDKALENWNRKGKNQNFILNQN